MQPNLELTKAWPSESRLTDDNRDGTAGCPCRMRGARRACVALLLAGLFLPHKAAWAGAAERPEPALPDAPRAQIPSHGGMAAAGPCQVRNAGAAMAARAASAAAAASGVGDPGWTNPEPRWETVPCPTLLPLINWYSRFLDGPQVKPMTPKEKAWLAVRNVADPFNGFTILASSAIAVGFDAHSLYGPGMYGFGRYLGVSSAQDITGEFLGTFLIPSIVHQDPHYHRMPNAAIPRRALHAITQIAWTQGDNGKGMLNYADLVGFALDDEIGNLYVPGRETNLPASASRYGIGLASAPIDNFVSEFLPDLARHIHIEIVVIQRIINQVAKTDAANGSP